MPDRPDLTADVIAVLAPLARDEWMTVTQLWDRLPEPRPVLETLHTHLRAMAADRVIRRKRRPSVTQSGRPIVVQLTTTGKKASCPTTTAT